MANIFRVYKDSQVTTDRIRAENAAQSIVTPERVVYVFGTADGTAPNFSTVSSALTYANSLTPTLAEPVVIRMFADSDGEPYTLAGLDPWIDYANDGIYFVSDFVRLNTSTTLPTTLPAGAQVWYIDANGVETLWVGHEDGSAWPAVGYKEYVATIGYSSFDDVANIITVINDSFGGVTIQYVDKFSFRFDFTVDNESAYESINFVVNSDNGELVALEQTYVKPTGLPGFILFTFRNNDGTAYADFENLNMFVSFYRYP